MDSLGYGTLIIVDGFGSFAPIHNENWVIERIWQILQSQSLPKDEVLQVSHWFPDGVSVGLALPQTQIMLHTFAARHMVSLNLFSPDRTATDIIGLIFRENFQVGRIEGRLAHHSGVLPHDKESALKMLFGERRYADLRLDDSLIEVLPGDCRP